MACLKQAPKNKGQAFLQGADSLLHISPVFSFGPHSDSPPYPLRTGPVPLFFLNTTILPVRNKGPRWKAGQLLQERLILSNPHFLYSDSHTGRKAALRWHGRLAHEEAPEQNPRNSRPGRQERRPVTGGTPVPPPGHLPSSRTKRLPGIRQPDNWPDKEDLLDN